jgi:hypothetical protein
MSDCQCKECALRKEAREAGQSERDPVVEAIVREMRAQICPLANTDEHFDCPMCDFAERAVEAGRALGQHERETDQWTRQAFARARAEAADEASEPLLKRIAELERRIATLHGACAEYERRIEAEGQRIADAKAEGYKEGHAAGSEECGTCDDSFEAGKADGAREALLAFADLLERGNQKRRGRSGVLVTNLVGMMRQRAGRGGEGESEP